MSGASAIEWTDATWNPVRGCSRVSEGCRNCYAERVAARFSDEGTETNDVNGHMAGAQPFAGFARQTPAGPRWTGEVALMRHALDWPLRWRGDKRARAEGRPSRVFVNSMSDLFHERLSDEEIAAVFGVMAASPQHVFQVLTKRPERALRWFRTAPWGIDAPNGPADVCVIAAGLRMGRDEFLTPIVPWPLPNVWLGVSVEDQATADERIPLLLQCPAAVRFVSYEPALATVDFWSIPDDRTRVAEFSARNTPLGGLDWVIVGGESGPGPRGGGSGRGPAGAGRPDRASARDQRGGLALDPPGPRQPARPVVRTRPGAPRHLRVARLPGRRYDRRVGRSIEPRQVPVGLASGGYCDDGTPAGGP